MGSGAAFSCPIEEVRGGKEGEREGEREGEKEGGRERGREDDGFWEGKTEAHSV